MDVSPIFFLIGLLLIGVSIALRLVLVVMKARTQAARSLPELEQEEDDASLPYPPVPLSTTHIATSGSTTVNTPRAFISSSWVQTNQNGAGYMGASSQVDVRPISQHPAFPFENFSSRRELARPMERPPLPSPENTEVPHVSVRQISQQRMIDMLGRMGNGLLLQGFINACDLHYDFANDCALVPCDLAEEVLRYATTSQETSHDGPRREICNTAGQVVAMSLPAPVVRYGMGEFTYLELDEEMRVIAESRRLWADKRAKAIGSKSPPPSILRRRKRLIGLHEAPKENKDSD